MRIHLLFLSLLFLLLAVSPAAAQDCYVHCSDGFYYPCEWGCPAPVLNCPGDCGCPGHLCEGGFLPALVGAACKVPAPSVSSRAIFSKLVLLNWQAVNLPDRPSRFQANFRRADVVLTARR